MHYSKASKAGVALAAAFAGVVAMAAMPASADGYGSDNTMFKRHFWRGQAYHGAGYHPLVSDIGRDTDRDVGKRGSYGEFVFSEPRG